MAQRHTRQRSAIETLFSNVHRPLSPNEVYELARREVPRLGIATVYRALNDLVSEKQLRRVDLPGQSSRYEKADLKHHHHFHCHVCDRVFDLDGCLLKHELDLPKGYLVEQHDITLTGKCPDCVE
jgi:Fur family ferric uptake transcriptional regulator